jgi:hypothetical protein
MDAEIQRRTGHRDAERPVVKSVYAIGGIGAVGCLLLSFMMQHLLKVKTDNGSSPVAVELQDLAGRNIVGAADVQVVLENGVRTMIVRVQTRQGVDRQKWATGIGRLLWRRASASREPPARMRFEVAGEGGVPPVRVEIDPPSAGAVKRDPAATSPASPTQSPAAPVRRE